MDDSSSVMYSLYSLNNTCEHCYRSSKPNVLKKHTQQQIIKKSVYFQLDSFYYCTTPNLSTTCQTEDENCQGGAINISPQAGSGVSISLSIDTCDFRACRSSHNGGAIAASGINTGIITNSVFNNCVSLGGCGGGLSLYKISSIQLDYNTFSECQSFSSGGALYICDFNVSEEDSCLSVGSKFRLCTSIDTDMGALFLYFSLNSNVRNNLILFKSLYFLSCKQTDSGYLVLFDEEQPHCGLDKNIFSDAFTNQDGAQILLKSRGIQCDNWISTLIFERYVAEFQSQGDSTILCGASPIFPCSSLFEAVNYADDGERSTSRVIFGEGTFTTFQGGNVSSKKLVIEGCTAETSTLSTSSLESGSLLSVSTGSLSIFRIRVSLLQSSLSAPTFLLSSTTPAKFGSISVNTLRITSSSSSVASCYVFVVVNGALRLSNTSFSEITTQKSLICLFESLNLAYDPSVQRIIEICDSNISNISSSSAVPVVFTALNTLYPPPQNPPSVPPSLTPVDLTICNVSAKSVSSEYCLAGGALGMIMGEGDRMEISYSYFEGCVCIEDNKAFEESISLGGAVFINLTIPVSSFHSYYYYSVPISPSSPSLPSSFYSLEPFDFKYDRMCNNSATYGKDIFIYYNNLPAQMKLTCFSLIMSPLDNDLTNSVCGTDSHSFNVTDLVSEGIVFVWYFVVLSSSDGVDSIFCGKENMPCKTLGEALLHFPPTDTFSTAAAQTAEQNTLIVTNTYSITNCYEFKSTLISSSVDGQTSSCSFTRIIRDLSLKQQLRSNGDQQCNFSCLMFESSLQSFASGSAFLFSGNSGISNLILGFGATFQLSNGNALFAVISGRFALNNVMISTAINSLDIHLSDLLVGAYPFLVDARSNSSAADNSSGHSFFSQHSMLFYSFCLFNISNCSVKIHSLASQLVTFSPLMSFSSCSNVSLSDGILSRNAHYTNNKGSLFTLKNCPNVSINNTSFSTFSSSSSNLQLSSADGLSDSSLSPSAPFHNRSLHSALHDIPEISNASNISQHPDNFYRSVSVMAASSQYAASSVLHLPTSDLPLQTSLHHPYVLKKESFHLRHSPSHSSSSLTCISASSLLHFEDCTAILNSVSFTRSSKGAISVYRSSVAIQQCRFESNQIGFDAFPSFSQNLLCEGAGSVDVQSLQSGDGARSGASMWFMNEGCTFIGLAAERSSPFFIPSLATVTSQAINDDLELTFRGQLLFPCDLSFQIIISSEQLEKQGYFEVAAEHSKAIEMPARSKAEEYTFHFTSVLNETTAIGSIPSSLVSNAPANCFVFAAILFRANDSCTSQTSSVCLRNRTDDGTGKGAGNVSKEIVVGSVAAAVSVTAAVTIMTVVFFVLRRKKKKEMQQVDPNKIERDEPTINANIIVAEEANNLPCAPVGSDETEEMRRKCEAKMLQITFPPSNSCPPGPDTNESCINMKNDDLADEPLPHDDSRALPQFPMYQNMYQLMNPSHLATPNAIEEYDASESCPTPDYTFVKDALLELKQKGIMHSEQSTDSKQVVQMPLQTTSCEHSDKLDQYELSVPCTEKASDFNSKESAAQTHSRSFCRSYSNKSLAQILTNNSSYSELQEAFPTCPPSQPRATSLPPSPSVSKSLRCMSCSTSPATSTIFTEASSATTSEITTAQQQSSKPSDVSSFGTLQTFYNAHEQHPSKSNSTSSCVHHFSSSISSGTPPSPSSSSRTSLDSSNTSIISTKASASSRCSSAAQSLSDSQHHLTEVDPEMFSPIRLSDFNGPSSASFLN